MKQIKYSLDNIDAVAQQLLADIDDAQVVTFTGSLGAGKTTFVRSLARAMGVTEPVTSPTFTYFNVYHVPEESLSPIKLIYHFDLYRLRNLQDFESAGFFEYLYQPDSIAFIEWPDILDVVLTHDVCHIGLRVTAPDERLLMYECK